jgi:zinc transport system ATP-binding protein
MTNQSTKDIIKHNPNLNDRPIIEFKNVNKNFDKRKILSNVNFKIYKGQITTIVGQNGAGKTTLANLILGLVKLDSGQLLMDRKLKIGYVPQKLDFDYTMPITVDAMISLLSKDSYKNLPLDLQEFIGTKEISNKDISEISGGQLQKLMLASTISSTPDLLILDEPTIFLDVTSQQKFYLLLEKYARDNDVTVLMISHDLYTVMKHADQVICLNGHVCCSGKPGEYLNDPKLKSNIENIGFYIHDHDHSHID